MIKLENINLTGGKKELLKDSSFEAKYGDVTLIYGESGCGKSTLLYEIGLLSEHKDISYFINDHDVRMLEESEILNLKRFEIGYVFQTSELFNDDDVLYNLNHFARMVNRSLNKNEIDDYLRLLRLHIKLDQKVKNLSGGERQRLAILCALIKESSILVLDEVTSTLDNENEVRIFQILQDISKTKKIAVILVSHSLKAKDYADVIYEFENQRLVCKKNSTNSTNCMQQEIDLSKELKLPFSHFIEYCFYYFKKHRFLNILLFVAMLCGISFISFIESYSDYYNVLVLEDIENLSYNEIWIYSTKYQDESNKSFNDNVVEEFLNAIDLDVEVYPYFEGICQIEGRNVKIVPFYVNEKNRRFVAREFQTSSLIFASNLYFLDDFEVYEPITINDENYYLEGIFEKGFRLYNSGNEYIATIEDIAKDIDPFIQFNGFIVRTKNFNDLKMLYNSAIQNSLICVSSLQDIEVLSQYQKDANRMMDYYKIGSMVFVILLITLFYVAYYHSRRKELAFLKVNGYTNKQIINILSLENFIRLFLCMISSIILNLIVNISVFQIYNNLFMTFIYDLMISLAVALFPHIFSMIYVYYLKPIEIYRR